MAKVGDTVRFLNATGGGVITRIEGQICYVDDSGFETPVLLREIVVVMPGGQEQYSRQSYRPMFDQKAYDSGKKSEPAPEVAPVVEQRPTPAPLPPAEETAHGDSLNVALVFEPSDLKRLDNSKFAAVLVNDSNYKLLFTFLRRKEGERGWNMVWNGELEANESMDIASLTHENLADYEKIAFQCVAVKEGKEFTLQAPVSVVRKMDLTKFHKFHCFRPGLYSDTPVIELSLVSGGVPYRQTEVDSSTLATAMSTPNKKNIEAELSQKFRVDKGRDGRKKQQPDNPHKVLPLIEVDLHIGELTDSLAGMEPKDMLEMQLAEVRRQMNENSKRIGQKLVFIHGKGEGVLRKAVLDLLKKEYPKAELQDASFREYGFGATLVTIH